MLTQEVPVHRRPLLCSLMLLLGALAPGFAWGDAWTTVPTIIVVAPDQDPRLPLVHEAVDFWNRTLTEIGTPFRLGPVTHTTEEIPASYLEQLSAYVLHRTSRAVPPPMPEQIKQLPRGISVVLSDGSFASFTSTARLASEGKMLVAIQSARAYPLPNVARNVIAHELGHAIGLGHNDDPTTLMCGRPAPCRPDAFTAAAARFFPLTAAEETFLLQLYPPQWPRQQ